MRNIKTHLMIFTVVLSLLFIGKISQIANVRTFTAVLYSELPPTIEPTPIMSPTPAPTPLPKLSKIKRPRTGLLNIGISTFGIMSNSWDCDAFLKNMKGIPEWHIALMYSSFGNDKKNYKCLERFADQPKARTFQFHLINEVCGRSGNCPWYEFHAPYSVGEYNKLWENKDRKLRQKFNEYVKPLKNFLEKTLPDRPWLECIISPGLESNLGEKAANNILDATREEFPYCKISWNGQNIVSWNADLIEKHGPNPNVPLGNCMVNLDGVDIDFPERRSPHINDGNEWSIAVGLNSLRKYIQYHANRCYLYYLWTWEGNCVLNGYTGKNPDLRQRKCGVSQIKKVQKLTTNEIRNANKTMSVEPAVFHWSYNESLPLQMCDKVKRKIIKPNIRRNKGYIKLPLSLNIKSLNVMYKTKLIDRYNLAKTRGETQYWESTVNPNKRYPYKTVLVAETIKKDLSIETVCWKINDPTN